MENNNKNTSAIKELLTNYKIYLAVIVVLLIIIVMLLKDRSAGEPPKEQTPVAEENSSEDPASDSQEPEAPEEEPEPENKLEANTHGSIDLLIQRYCNYIASGDVENLEEIVDVLSDEEKESIRNRASFIESFDNVACYTKDGPVEDSYIVFVCYDMKLINIETSAPDIICLYVSPDEGDGRRIHYGTVDEGMQDYVAELEQDPEVKALYDDVSARYQAAQESDETLAAFVQKITGQVAEVEPEEAPEETPAEETEEAPAEETPEEAPQEPESAAAAQNRQTRVSETVNVRTEPSTESARVTLAYQGDEITQVESYDNGWSKVEYKGQSGYVMTEYLE